jgi:tetratricopeptide (TPR) repeat protein
MKAPIVLSLSLSLLLAFGSAGAALCLDSAFTRLDKSASDACATGDYKRAQSQWNKLLDRLNLALARGDESKSINEQMEATLRHLGECALAQKNYDSADDYLRQAKTALDSLKEQDADLDKDFKDLASNYRLIDLNNLGALGIAGPIVMAALGDFHPNKVSLSKTDLGHHVSVVLADDVIKDIGAKGITQVGVSKSISFDLIQGTAGEITLANISGIKVRAGFWVNIINSTLKLDEAQRPVALVTAQKMGISQSVSTPVPDVIYLPVAAIVSQVKSLFGDDSSQPQAITATQKNDPSRANDPSPANALSPATTVTRGDAVQAPAAADGNPQGAATSAAMSQAGANGAVPVTNTIDTTVSGTLLPIPSIQTGPISPEPASTPANATKPEPIN